MRSIRNQLKTPLKNYGGDDKEWVISFVDMLSLLLIFLILSFKTQHQEFVESTQKEKLSEAPPVDFQREPASVEKELPSPSILALKEKFSTIIEGETILKDDTIIINYPQSNFFDSSSHRLNEEGKALVKEVIQKLSVHKNDVYVSVQGHTDPKNFKITMTRNLSDNWELSVLRATTVLKELIRDGFDPGYLMAEGYSFKNTKLNPQSDDRYMRKVTFKIRQRKR